VCATGVQPNCRRAAGPEQIRGSSLLPRLADGGNSLREIVEAVDLRRLDALVSEHDPRHVPTELRAEPRGRVVPKLVWVPGRDASGLSCPGDRPAVALPAVALAGTAPGVELRAIDLGGLHGGLAQLALPLAEPAHRVLWAEDVVFGLLASE